MKITLVLPAVQFAPTDHPARCPQCGSPYLARHGHLQKPLTDTKLAAVQVMRYRCSGCGKTFRHYPQGVDRAPEPAPTGAGRPDAGSGALL